MSPAQTPTFSPSSPLAGELIAQFSDPTVSLADLAARHNTTLDSLALWIARAEVSERLDSVHALAISRVRYLSSLLLSKSVDALSQVLAAARADLDSDSVRAAEAAPLSASSTQSQPTTSTPGSTTNLPSHGQSHARSPELRHRTLETLRRTATRILQLSSYNPPRLFASPQLPRATQYPRGHAGANEAARPPAASPLLPAIRTNHPAKSPVGSAAADRATRPQATSPSVSTLAPLLPLPDLTKFLRSPPRSPAALLQTAGAATPSFSRSNEHWP